MARATTSAATTDAGGGRKGSGAVAWLALLAGIAGVVLSLTARGKGGGGGGGSGGDLDGRLDALERRVRDGVQDDLKRQLAKAEETLGKAEARLASAEARLKPMVEEAKRVAAAAGVSAGDHAEAFESRVREVADSATKLGQRVDALSASVKDLESRPVAVARPAAGPAPEAPKATPKAPEPEPEPTGPTPEEIAANKAKVAAAIADLASPDVTKAFPACVALGKLGDLSAVDPLVKVLRDHKDPLVRTAAATALGGLHACDAVPALLQAMLDKDDGVVLASGRSFTRITEMDSGLTGTPTRKEKNDAREKWSKWWTSNEEAVRTKWKQPKAEGPAPAGDPPK